MTVALLSIGTELTRGETVNSTSAWPPAELVGAGFTVAGMETAPDAPESVVGAIRRLSASARIVVATGGRGPPTGDPTPPPPRPPRRRRRPRRRGGAGARRERSFGHPPPGRVVRQGHEPRPGEAGRH